MNELKEDNELYDTNFLLVSLAAFIFRVTGHNIRARNYMTAEGSIDFVMVKNDQLKFTIVMSSKKPIENVEEIQELLSEEIKLKYKKATDYFLDQNPLYKKLKKHHNIFVISSPFSWKLLENVI